MEDVIAPLLYLVVLTGPMWGSWLWWKIEGSPPQRMRGEA